MAAGMHWAIRRWDILCMLVLLISYHFLEGFYTHPSFAGICSQRKVMAVAKGMIVVPWIVSFNSPIKVRYGCLRCAWSRDFQGLRCSWGPS